MPDGSTTGPELTTLAEHWRARADALRRELDTRTPEKDPALDAIRVEGIRRRIENAERVAAFTQRRAGEVARQRVEVERSQQQDRTRQQTDRSRQEREHKARVAEWEQRRRAAVD